MHNPLQSSERAAPAPLPLLRIGLSVPILPRTFKVRRHSIPLHEFGF